MLLLRFIFLSIYVPLLISARKSSKNHKEKELSPKEMKSVIENHKGKDCYRNLKAPLDVVFLVDRSSQHVLKTAPKFMSIASELQNYYKGSRFGLTFFSDFMCTDWHPKANCPKLVKKDHEHMDPEGCYTFNTSLTMDWKKIKYASKATSYLGRYGVVSGLAGLLLTSGDPRIGWSTTKQSENSRNRVIFMFSNDGTHCCDKKYGIKNPPIGDGTDRCLTMNDPTPEFVAQKLEEKGISLFLVLSEGGVVVNTFKHWKETLKKMGTAYSLMNMDDDDKADVIKAFKEFIIKMVYSWGTGPCTTEVKEELSRPRPPVVYKPSPYYVQWVSQGNRGPGKDIPYPKMLSAVEGAKPPQRYRNHKAPLDLVFLVDRSSRASLDMIAKLVEIVDQLKAEYKGSRFGINFYSDFSCEDWNTKEDCVGAENSEWDHINPEGCYTFNTSLTTDVAIVKSVAASISLLPSRNQNSGVAALLLTAADSRVGWEATKQSERNRVVVIISSDGTHCCGKLYGIRNTPRGDGTDKCQMMNNPNPELAGQKLRDKGISLFLLLANGASNGDTFESWIEMADRMNVTYGVANTIDDDVSVIFTKIQQFLVLVVYNLGIMVTTESANNGKPVEANSQVIHHHHYHTTVYKLSPYYMEHLSRQAGEGKPKQVEISWDQLVVNEDDPKTVNFHRTERPGVSNKEMEKVVGKTEGKDCYRDPQSPLDLVFVVDRSSQETLTLAPKVIKMVDQMKREYNGSLFGISFFADFWCPDWNEAEDCPEFVKEEWDHMDPEGCYTFHTGLTNEVDIIKSAAKSMKLLPSINSESGIAALLLAATDSKIGWSKEPTLDRNRVIVVITDDATHCCGKFYGTKNPPKGDGTDICQQIDNPTPEFVGEVLRRSEISLFLTGANGGSDQDTFQSWSGMAKRLNVTFAAANTAEDDNAEILQKFREFMVKVVYNAGKIPCSARKPRTY